MKDAAGASADAAPITARNGSSRLIFIAGIMHSGTTIATHLLLTATGAKVSGSLHEDLPHPKMLSAVEHDATRWVVVKCPSECEQVATCRGRPSKYVAEVQIEALQRWPLATLVYMRRDPTDLLLSHARRDARRIDDVSAEYLARRWAENRAIDRRWMAFVAQRKVSATGRSLAVQLMDVAADPARYLTDVLGAGEHGEGHHAREGARGSHAPRPSKESGPGAHNRLRMWQIGADVSPQTVRNASGDDLRTVVRTLLDANVSFSSGSRYSPAKHL